MAQDKVNPVLKNHSTKMHRGMEIKVSQLLTSTPDGDECMAGSFNTEERASGTQHTSKNKWSIYLVIHLKITI